MLAWISTLDPFSKNCKFILLISVKDSGFARSKYMHAIGDCFIEEPSLSGVARSLLLINFVAIPAIKDIPMSFIDSSSLNLHFYLSWAEGQNEKKAYELCI